MNCHVTGSLSAMFIMFRGEDKSSFNETAGSVLAQFSMSLGQFGDFYDDFDSAKYPVMAKVNTIFCHMFGKKTFATVC